MLIEEEEKKLVKHLREIELEWAVGKEVYGNLIINKKIKPERVLLFRFYFVLAKYFKKPAAYAAGRLTRISGISFRRVLPIFFKSRASICRIRSLDI